MSGKAPVANSAAGFERAPLSGFGLPLFLQERFDSGDGVSTLPHLTPSHSSPHYEEGMTLIQAAQNGDSVTVWMLLSSASAQSLIHYQDEASGSTPLYFAAQNGHASVTKQLIDACCNIDLQAMPNRATPLFVAAQNGHASVTKLLIQARCNINLQRKDGYTPFNTAYIKLRVLYRRLMVGDVTQLVTYCWKPKSRR
jgi:hypothetical protein